VWLAASLAISALIGVGAANLNSVPKVAVVPVVGAGIGVYFLSQRRYWHLLRVEAPFALLLLGVVQWRFRSLASATADPIDSTVVLTACLVGAAAALSIGSLATPTAVPRHRDMTPFWLMLGLVCVGVVASCLAADPAVALYQTVLLAIALLVVVAAARASDDAVPRLARTLFWFLVAMVALVWLGAILDPSEAFKPLLRIAGGVSSPIGNRLRGVLPPTNSDTVGIYGAFLCLWSAAICLLGTRRRRSLYIGLSGLGAITVLLSQFRTGYAMVLVGGAVLLIIVGRSRVSSLLLVTCGVVCVFLAVLLIGPGSVYRTSEGLAFRGQTQKLASSGTGRTDLWNGEVQVWKRSPIFGKGLISASRNEVIAPLGGEVNQSHSSWFEALGGTGTLGVVFLLGALIWTGVMAVVKRLAIPAILWSALVVLSVTSVSLVIYTFGFMVFALVMLWVADGRSFVAVGSRSMEGVGS
jgi:O-antigen ligase